MKANVFKGTMLLGTNGPGVQCDEGAITMVADLIQEAGLNCADVEMEFVDGALVIRRAGAFNGIPKDRDELIATLLACQFFGGRWVAPAERGVILTGPFNSAEGHVAHSDRTFVIMIKIDDQGGSGHLTAEELAAYIADSGVADAPVRIFFFGSDSLGQGAGIWVQPVSEEKSTQP